MGGKKRGKNRGSQNSIDPNHSANSDNCENLPKRTKENTSNFLNNTPYNYLSSTQVETMAGSSNSLNFSGVEFDIQKFASNKNPTMLDVMQGIGSILGILSDLKLDLNECRKINERHESEISDLKLQNTQTINQLDNLRSEVNILQQKQIDNEIIISGFQEKLDQHSECSIISKFCDHTQFNRDLISKHFSFQSAGNINFLVLSFTNIDAKIKFKQICKEKGPITNSMISSTSNTNVNKRDTPLRINNRLTKVNQEIARELRSLLDNKKISAIRFRNSCFQYQLPNSKTYVSASNVQHIINI